MITLTKKIAVALVVLIAGCGGAPEHEGTSEPETLGTTEAALVTGKDLTLLGPPTPTPTAGQQNQVTIAYTAWNQGTVATVASVTKFYLSLNDVLDAGDTYLSSCDQSVPALASNQAWSPNWNCQIPTGTPLGRYRVIAVVDATGTNFEANENNNVVSSGTNTFVVGPDLEAGSGASPVNIVGTDLVRVSARVRNSGTQTAAASQSNVYLSANGVIDAGDVLLCSIPVPALAPSQIDSYFAMDCPIPPSLFGNYVVIDRRDAANVVVEGDETNNDRTTISVTLGPDVRVTRLAVADVGGNTARIQYVVGNGGSKVAVPSTIRFYLSTNATFDAVDTLLCSASVPSINANTNDGPGGGGSAYVGLLPMLEIQCASGTSLAGKYIIGVADALNVITEPNEANSASRLVGSTPDWVPTGLTATVSNGFINETLTVQNQGSAAGSGNVTSRHYLSADQTWDATDLPLICINTGGPIAPGAFVTYPTQMCSAGGLHGAFYVITAVDVYDITLRESNERNNFRVTPITLP